MSKREKLLAKLNNKTLSGREAETLLGMMGFTLLRQKGSHQTWGKGSKTITLVADKSELKHYQFKQIKEVLES